MRGEGRHRVPHLRSLSDALTAPPAAPPRPRPDEINGGASNETCAAEINSTIVHLLRVHAGRAPTNAETVLTSDLAVVTLRDCLTAAERTLADEGLSALAKWKYAPPFTRASEPKPQRSSRKSPVYRSSPTSRLNKRSPTWR